MLLKPGQNFFSARQIDFKNLTSIELKLGEKIVGGVQLISPPHTGFFFYHKIIRYSRIFLHLNDVFNFVHMYFFFTSFYCNKLFQYFIKWPVEIVPSKFYYFFIDKICSINNYEMANVFKMLDHLLKNINYTVIQTRKLKGSRT